MIEMTAKSFCDLMDECIFSVGQSGDANRITEEFLKRLKEYQNEMDKQ